MQAFMAYTGGLLSIALAAIHVWQVVRDRARLLVRPYVVQTTYMGADRKLVDETYAYVDVVNPSTRAVAVVECLLDAEDGTSLGIRLRKSRQQLPVSLAHGDLVGFLVPVTTLLPPKMPEGKYGVTVRDTIGRKHKPSRKALRALNEQLREAVGL